MDNQDPPTKPLEPLIIEAQRIEEDAKHSSKGHFAASGGWSCIHFAIGIPTTIGSAIASVYAFSDQSRIAGSLALLVAVGAALATFLNPNKNASHHLSAGNSYKAIQNKARRFHQIHCAPSSDPEELNEQIDALASELDSLNIASPKIPRWAYKKGKKGIDSGEATYRVDQLDI